MPIKKTLKRHLLIASAVVGLGVQAMDAPPTPAQAVKITTQRMENQSLLHQIQNNQKITYNGLYFDTPLFREKQKSNQSLADFNFYFHQDETGLSIQDGTKTYFILMPKETLEGLISALIAKDKGQSAAPVSRPENPNEWTFQSQYPQILTLENGKRRPAQEAELNIIFDKALDAFTACNSENIIDAKKMIQTYAERVGGASGKTLRVGMNALFLKSMQNALLAKFAKGYKTEVVASLKALPDLRQEEQTAFEQTKAKALLAFHQKETEKRIAQQKRQEAEKKRQASLVAFQSISNLKVEKNPHFPQTILSFSQDNTYVEIVNVPKSFFSRLTICDNEGELVSCRELEPEEWQQLQKVLPASLTKEQKALLDTTFLQRLFEKSSPQLLAKATLPQRYR